MKNLILLSFLFIVVSCNKDIEETANSPLSCTEAEYKLEFNLVLDNEVCFPDGNSLILSDVQHQLCPCEVLCDSEGDIFFALETFDDIQDYIIIETKEFLSRDVFKDSVIFSDYEITDFSFSYGTEDEEVPACAADFDPEKIKATFVISPM